MVAVK